MVTAGGQYQNTWNADTKLDKRTETTSNNQAYVKSYNGSQSLVDINQSPSPWKIACYNGDSCLSTNYPTEDGHCASKSYVDDIQYWNSIEESLSGMDDEFYFTLDAYCQYQVSASIKITYIRDGQTYRDIINFNTGSLYVPDTGSVHDYGSVASFVKLDATATEFIAPDFQGMYVMIGEHYQDGVYVEGDDGTDHYETRVYVSEPAAAYNIDAQELQVLITYKKV
jgi:hypothetical protein